MESSLPLLARTGDAGATWQFAALPAEAAGQLVAAKAIYLAARDRERGWIAANLATSSNFSHGALWYTQDGGATWQERSLPLGEAFQPAGGEAGYVAGGPRGDALWFTRDGGITWQEQRLPRVPAAGERIKVYPPLVTIDGSLAVLPLLIRSEGEQVVEWYARADAGETWELVQRYTVAEATGLSMPETDSRAWLVERAGLVLPPVLPLPYFADRALGDGRSLLEVKMATPLDGWELAQGAGLQPTLRATHDGGHTWAEITLPAMRTEAEGAAARLPQGLGAAAAVATVTRTTTVRGPGFDVCELPTISELATWFAASPYRTVNLYLGGVLRYCANQNLTAATLATLSAQGWTFIPTWVGPQAPCTKYKVRYSDNPSDAFAQGRAEADAALAAAKAVGLSEADGSGTIIYYDMEAYDGSDESCVAAAQAFVSGWSSRLRERGSQAGLYGLGCNPPMGRYASIGAPPDAIWMAAWNRDAYDPNMTVWGIFCIDDSLWARSQRIRQYTNSHDETWGGVTIEIDSNAVDSIVADLDVAPPTPIPTPTPQPSVLLEAPELAPGYDGGMCGAGWHMLINAPRLSSLSRRQPGSQRHDSAAPGACQAGQLAAGDSVRRLLPGGGVYSGPRRAAVGLPRRRAGRRYGYGLLFRAGCRRHDGEEGQPVSGRRRLAAAGHLPVSGRYGGEGNAGHRHRRAGLHAHSRRQRAAGHANRKLAARQPVSLLAAGHPAPG